MKDFKLSPEQHDDFSAYLFDAVTEGRMMVVNVRRVSDNTMVPVLGVMTGDRMETVRFAAIAEVLDPASDEVVYHAPLASDNLPPGITRSESVPASILKPGETPDGYKSIIGAEFIRSSAALEEANPVQRSPGAARV